MKKSIYLFITLAAVSVLAAGCALPQQLRYMVDPPKSGEILFQDDFSSRGSWDTWNDAQSIVDFSSGGLQFFVNHTNYDYWSILNHYFADTSIQVDATRMSGPVDNKYGIVCRYQNSENFYQFLVSSDGYFGIVKIVNGEKSLLSSNQLEYDEVIVSDDGSFNQIQAVCLGSSLTLSVNGVLLASAFDMDLDDGKVGLWAGTNGEQAVDILFKNFQVSEP